MSIPERTAAQPTGGATLLGRPAARSIDQMADVLAEVKRTLRAMLALQPGERVLDVGCGTGVDVAEMAAQVGRDGLVAGVDTVAAVLAEARSRTRQALAQIDLRIADGAALPFAGDSFDACRAERVLQHVPAPERVIAEMVRVVRPGGRIVAADPDHGMWALDMDHEEPARSVLTWWFDHITNPWIGRRLPGLLQEAGLTGVQIGLQPVVLRELGAADALTGVAAAAGAAAAQGVITQAQAAAWNEELRARAATGRFLMYGVIAAVHGTKSAEPR